MSAFDAFPENAIEFRVADCRCLGFVPLSKTGAELLFEVFSRRYERSATLVTSNLPFNEWTEAFGSERLTGASLDRLTPAQGQQTEAVSEVSFLIILPAAWPD